MTEFVKQALMLAHCNMEKFDEQNPRIGEKNLMESAAYLEQVLATKYPAGAFELVGCVRRGFNQSYDSYTLVSKDSPACRFEAKVSTTLNGFTCLEGFYNILSGPAFTAMLTECVRSREPDADVFCILNRPFPENVDADTPVSEAARMPFSFAEARIVLRENGTPFEERIDGLRGLLIDEGIRGSYVAALLLPGVQAPVSWESALKVIPVQWGGEKVYSQIGSFVIR